MFVKNCTKIEQKLFLKTHWSSLITKHQSTAFAAQPLFPNSINNFTIAIPQRHSSQNPMKFTYTPPSTFSMLPFPTTQSHAKISFIVSCITVIPYSFCSNQNGPHIRCISHHKVHKYILAIPNRINNPPHLGHDRPTLTAISVQILSVISISLKLISSSIYFSD